MLKIHSTTYGEKSKLYDININGFDTDCEFARVSAMPFNTWWPGHQRPLDQTEEAAFVSFESDERACFKIKASVTPERVVLRPLSKNVSVSVDNENNICFELSEAGGYVLEVNGIHNPLHIFFNPLKDYENEYKKDKENGRTVYYYGAGEHNIGIVELPSHSSVFVDSNAVVYGGFFAFDATDIKIYGYGIIDGSKEIRTSETRLVPVLASRSEFQNFTPIDMFTPEREKFDTFMQESNCLNVSIRFFFCKNVTCEGVILRDSVSFCLVPAACDNVVIDNIKTIGMWRYNTDGIDIFNSSNITVKNCFLRNFDDCVVIKGMVGWDFKNNENIVIDNCVVWCDWGAACELGAETNADEYKNILFKNCNILHDASGAMMRIHHHNRADIHQIHYENMHCEFTCDQMNPVFQESDSHTYEYKKNTYQPFIFDLRVNKENNYGRDNLQGPIHDISFNNIYLHIEDGVTPKPQIHFIGVNEKCSVYNIQLENFYINGKKVEDINELEPDIEEYVYDIKFK